MRDAGAMSNPRLAHLLELADKGPALRAALAEEVASLLVDWPNDCPLEMRPLPAANAATCVPWPYGSSVRPSPVKSSL